MKRQRILLLGLVAILVSGCNTTPAQDDASSDIRKLISGTFAPLYDLSIMNSGAISLFYCSASFHNKNERWPTNYTELSNFVKQSDGYLMLGEYERVELKPLPSDSLDVRYVLPGRTNEMKFILGNPIEKK